jgi:drug/metabolite transporter (DMT)-like permease
MSQKTSLVIGVTAGCVSVLIAAAWQIATRYGVTTSLKAHDIALLRYGIPALILLPLLLKHGFLPKDTPLNWVIVMICGGGFGYGALAITGARFSPTAHMGILLSGMVPLFTIALLALFANERVGRTRMIGYVLILLGAVAFGFASARMSLADAWIGDLFFLGAAFVWSVYTFAFRKVTLSPWYATAIVCFWSSLVVSLWALFTGDTMLLRAPRTDVFLQIAIQGLVAGLVGSYVFVVSVRHLGGSNAAIFAAFVPVLSALGGYFVLSETVSLPTALAIAVVMIGIVLARKRADR